MATKAKTLDVKLSGSHLLIVESPAKSKTIMKYLGKWFVVKASFGHVVDLPKKNMWIDIKNKFLPTYEVSPDKKKVIAELKREAKKVDQVWIATDEDREWEAIGRHVANQLGLDISKTPRIVFHEITKTAIQNAVKEPRILDMNLVDAQQARRILDRLVWFELSPVLWRKIKPSLSAGRVQSVAVRVIVEREREIQDFDSKSSFKIVGDFIGDAKKAFQAELSTKMPDGETTRKFLESIKDSSFKISKIDTKPGKKSPSAPFTTSTLQQEASRKMGMPVARTMQVAQKLYEAGAITYMRTDSLNLSDMALQAAESEIIKQFGKEYSKPTKYKSKSKWAQEAHECIRPTDMSKTMAGSDAQQKKLYELIRKRTVASQMTPAVLEKTKATIDISSSSKVKFFAQWEVIKFDGFLKLYLESKDDEDEEDQKGMLPKLSKWEDLDMQQVIAKELFSKHPPRFTEASLVKKLEELGIGRPSTYAPTISTIQKRWYIVKENRDGMARNLMIFTLKSGTITEQIKKQMTGAEKQKLFPTDIGMIVNDFLVENFSKVLDYGFTANVEEQFDCVAHWEIQRNKMIEDFYTPFHKWVETVLWDKEFVKTEKELWKDPKTGLTIIARMWKYWPLVQLWINDETETPKFAPLLPGKNIETMTLEDAFKCFELPRSLWEYEGKEMVVNIWRFGPYVKYWTLFASLKRAKADEAWDDPYTITTERAIELVKDKLEFEKNKYIKEYDHKKGKIEILNGRYGAYIKYEKQNFKIPKKLKESKDPKKITKKECIEIIEWWSVKRTKKK